MRPSRLPTDASGQKLSFYFVLRLSKVQTIAHIMIDEANKQDQPLREQERLTFHGSHAEQNDSTTGTTGRFDDAPLFSSSRQTKNSRGDDIAPKSSVPELEFKDQVRECAPANKISQNIVASAKRKTNNLEVEFKDQCRGQTTRKSPSSFVKKRGPDELLVEAQLVSLGEQFRGSIIEVAASDNATSSRLWSTQRVIAVITLVLVLVGAAVGAALSFRSSSPIGSDDESSMDSLDPIHQALVDLVNDITFLNDSVAYPVGHGWMTVEERLAISTPEERALAWMIEDDPMRVTLEVSSVTAFKVQQRYALLTLYFQEAKPQWTSLEGWLTGKHECDWYGVHCVEVAGDVQQNLVVTEINLSENNLHGRLPDDLALLSSLTFFDASKNSIRGSIPTSLEEWTALRHFAVSNNPLTGTLPESFGLSWTNLEKFYVDNNSLGGHIPASLSLWTNLTHVHVHHNNFIGTIPLFVHDWEQVKEFFFNDNMFHGKLPAANWVNLTSFVVSNNNISGALPEEIGEWLQLEIFSVFHNELTGTLPNGIGKWTNLHRVSVDGNQFTGTIPLSIENWRQVKDATFSQNNFTGVIPTGICSASTLRYLWADCREVECSCCRTARKTEEDYERCDS